MPALLDGRFLGSQTPVSDDRGSLQIRPTFDIRKQPVYIAPRRLATKSCKNSALCCRLRAAASSAFKLHPSKLLLLCEPCGWRVKKMEETRNKSIDASTYDGAIEPPSVYPADRNWVLDSMDGLEKVK